MIKSMPIYLVKAEETFDKKYLPTKRLTAFKTSGFARQKDDAKTTKSVSIFGGPILGAREIQSKCPLEEHKFYYSNITPTEKNSLIAYG